MARAYFVERKTKETLVAVAVSLDGGPLPSESAYIADEITSRHAYESSATQTIQVDTGVGFFDHVNTLWARPG